MYSKVILWYVYWFFATPWTVARSAPLSWDFPGKSTGVGCHFLLQGIFPTGIETLSPALAGGFFTTELWLQPYGKTEMNFLARLIYVFFLYSFPLPIGYEVLFPVL